MEHFVIVDVFVVFTEEELCGLGIFLRVDIVELNPQLIVLKYLFFYCMILIFNVFRVGFDQVGGDVILGYEIVLFHHHG